MAPVATATYEYHGPLELVETWSRTPIAGRGEDTLSEADDVFPFTVWLLMVCDTLPLVLLYVPAVGAVTFTLTVHVPPAAIVPPEKEIEPAPAVGANVGVPQPLVEALGVLATAMAPGEVGNVLLKATPLRASFSLGLVSRKVRVDVPPVKIELRLNCWEMLGGRTAVSDALPKPVEV